MYTAEARNKTDLDGYKSMDKTVVNALSSTMKNGIDDDI